MIGSTLGIVLYASYVIEITKIIFHKVLTVVATISVACLLSFSTFGNLMDPRTYYFGLFLVDLLTAALVLDILVNTRSIIRRLLAMKWLVWVGSISYGLYLWHVLIYHTIQHLGFNDLTLITVGSLVSFLVATLSYYGMERPILKLKKRFTRTAANNSPQPASATLRCADEVGA